jgi:hypothetical protein
VASKQLIYNDLFLTAKNLQPKNDGTAHG